MILLVTYGHLDMSNAKIRMVKIAGTENLPKIYPKVRKCFCNKFKSCSWSGSRCKRLFTKKKRRCKRLSLMRFLCNEIDYCYCQLDNNSCSKL